MDLTANESIPHLFHLIELLNDGDLITRLTEQEATNLCRLEFVSGVAVYERNKETGGKDVKLRYLKLTVSPRKLYIVLKRTSVKGGRISAAGSKTTYTDRFGVFHDQAKCNAYVGGPSRLGIVSIA